MSVPVTIEHLHALGERLAESGVGNVESWRRKWRRDSPERLGDFAAEAYCALTLRRAGFAVEFVSADPPDLRIEIDGVSAGVEVKNFRNKLQDDLDRVAMDRASAEGLLAVIGQCELTEDDSGWEQAVRSVTRKAGAPSTQIDYVFLHSHSDCIEEVDVMTAKDELVDRRLNDPRLRRLRGIALLANWYSIREGRSFWFFPIDRAVAAADPVGRTIGGILRWQAAAGPAW
jgi:hypothetical protein